MSSEEERDASITQSTGGEAEAINERYLLLRQIGAGGCGAVYEALDQQLGRTVAVKLLHSSGALSETQSARFSMEARLTSQLKDPHTVTVFDAGRDQQGRLFLVTELLHGEPLDKRLKREPLSRTEIFRVFTPLCAALHEAHQLGIIHRDIKPANIFLLGVGETLMPKLLDFGIAIFIEDSQLPHPTPPHPDQLAERRLAERRLTKPGELVGSPLYLSPEQIKGAPLSSASDLFSLGVMLYETLAGSPPFQGRDESLFELCESIIYRPHPPLPDHADRPWAQAFTPLIDQLLQKDPTSRIADAAALQRALKALERRLDGLLTDQRLLDADERLSNAHTEEQTPLERGERAVTLADERIDHEEEQPGLEPPPRSGRLWLLPLVLCAGLIIAGWFSAQRHQTRLRGELTAFLPLLDEGGEVGAAALGRFL
ncbi:MAG: serine/threonine-protein kinase, partial [Myxococcota bacterium]|nr:serine/threonine-protein kinase [Myxococcota bacterium]